ncbi:MAG: hypothetical protein HQ592_02145 [Planctomycetes bacterium]|nr:hypothetical protein [Planctomycetota bacterium]
MKTTERMYVVVAKLTNMIKAISAASKYGGFIQKLKDDGKFVAAGKWSDNSGGMLILRADSLEEAREIAGEDPLIKSGAVLHDVKEWDATFDFEPIEY